MALHPLFSVSKVTTRAFHECYCLLPFLLVYLFRAWKNTDTKTPCITDVLFPDEDRRLGASDKFAKYFPSQHNL